MVDFRALAIPAIIVLLVGGTISFFMAFSFYPEKHVNVKINGECYEFLDNAYAKYKKLQAEKELLIYRLQANAIGSPNTIIPVIFSGTGEEVDDFVKRYNIDIITSQKIGANNNYIDKYVVKATMTKQDFERIINDLTIKDLDPLTKSISGSIGLQPNSYITEQEGEQISLYSKDFMRNGIQQIIDASNANSSDYDGVKQAECRTKIQY
ncbi:MAG TPA: hypothetical protein VE573_08710 [Nitrososphaeraceae archaeon]|jgi:hypothetical protein|nr:hypothetical protein [Nitrososphaeraceae archaeon]